MNCGELTSPKFIGNTFLWEEKGTLIIGNILLFIRHSPQIQLFPTQLTLPVQESISGSQLYNSPGSLRSRTHSTSCLLTKNPIICPNYVNTSAKLSLQIQIFWNRDKESRSHRRGNNLAPKGMAKGHTPLQQERPV